MPPNRHHPTSAFLRLRVKQDTITAEGLADCRLGADGHGGAPAAWWNWDGHALTAGGDAVGLYPLFHRVHRDGIAISGSLVRLIADEPDDPDDPAMAVALRLGFFLKDQTPFKSIRALPPNGRLRWSSGSLEVEGRPGIPAARAVSFEEALDGYVGLFRTAIERRLSREGQRTTVPLSGGRDSRHILLELHRQGHLPHECVTLGNAARGSPDQQSARLLAEAVGVPHRMIWPRRPYFEDALRKDVLTHLCADEHAWMMPLADDVTAQAQVSFDGLGGDVLSAGLFLTPRRLELFAHGRFEELARDFFAQFGLSEQALQALPRERFGEALDLDLAIARTVQELEQHAEAPNPVASFCFWNRTRREIALSPFGLMADVPVRVPFADPELVAFLLSLPAEFSLDARLHSEVLRRAYPEFASIPFAADIKGSPARRRISSVQATLRSRMQAFGFARKREHIPLPAAVRELALGASPLPGRMPGHLKRYLRNLIALSDPANARWALQFTEQARQRLLREREINLQSQR